MTVVHNYGHDGTGVFWSWGCAADVVAACGLG
jgi:D-amino-acid oxidase